MIIPLLVAATAAASPPADAADALGSPAPVFDPAIAPPSDATGAQALGLPFGDAAQGCRAIFPLTKKNVPFTRRLREALVEAGYKNALEREKLAVAVVDLTPETHIHYAAVNDNTMIYAASLPKIAALLAVAQGAKEGRVKWTPEVAADASRMINESSNPAASRMVRLATVPYIEEVLRRPGYCFYGDQRGGLWLGRGFGGGGPSVRDPVTQSVHGATARQVARFYTMLDRGLLVGPVGNARIAEAMGPPELNHKFVKGLRGSGARILARKSGTWRSFHSDSALVEHGDARYVVVALSKLRNGPEVLTAVARIVDRLVIEGAHRVAPRPAD